MTSTHRYETRSHSNSMAGAFEPEDKSSIDLVLQEKTASTNLLLDLFFQPATTNTQLKGKEKIPVFEKHIIDLIMHPYHRSLHLSTTHWVTFLYKLRNIINNDNKRPHWLKFLSQAIAYNNTTHEKVFNEVVIYKALARKCKEKIRLLTPHLVDSEEHFIAKEINNENLQTKLNDI